MEHYGIIPHITSERLATMGMPAGLVPRAPCDTYICFNAFRIY
jgi:hypothetical protein